MVSDDYCAATGQYSFSLTAAGCCVHIFHFKSSSFLTTTYGNLYCVPVNIQSNGVFGGPYPFQLGAWLTFYRDSLGCCLDVWQGFGLLGLRLSGSAIRLWVTLFPLHLVLESSTTACGIALGVVVDGLKEHVVLYCSLYG